MKKHTGLTFFAGWMVLLLVVGAAAWYITTPAGPSPEEIYAAEIDPLIDEYNAAVELLGELDRPLEQRTPQWSATVVAAAAALPPIHARMVAVTPPPQYVEFHRLLIAWTSSCTIAARMFGAATKSDNLADYLVAALAGAECQARLAEQNLYAETMHSPILPAAE